MIIGGGTAPGYLSLEAVKHLSRAHVVYVDTYTMPGASWLLEEARRFNDNVKEATRETLESSSERILEEAARSYVAVLVPGDPLIATTHISLLVEANLKGVESKYIPGVSGVCSAKAASGLHYYRFGRTVTIPGPWRRVKPYSVVEAIYSNLCINLHTLLLLDVDDNGNQLAPHDAVRILEEAEREITQEAGVDPMLARLPLLIVAEAAGTDRQRITLYHNPRELSRRSEWTAPSSIIIPAILHETELWAIRGLYGGDFRYERDIHESLATRACNSYAMLKRILSG